MVYFFNLMPKTYGQHCALARALDRVGDRWTLLIVRELLVGPRPWADLKAGLPGIATNLLAARLRELEADGIVRRDQAYELTPLGRELAEPVHALVRWGGNFMAAPGPGDAFSPHWLVVALGAVLPAPARPWRLRVDGVEIALRPDGPALVREPAAGEPVLECDGPTALGLAAGRIGLDEAVASGRARVAAGDAAVVEAALAR